MAIESTTFFSVIEKHGLVSEKQLAALKTAVKKDSVSQGDLESMVAKKYFSKWQAQRLLSGKHNFSVGDFRLLDFLGKDEFGEVYLVRPKTSKQTLRLKLLSKEFCSDQSRLGPYLERVKSFQAVQNPRIPKVVQVAAAGGRSIVVTELPPGKPLVERLSGKAQAESLVKQIVGKIAGTISELEMADLNHGTVNGHSIHITDQQKLALDLPGDIGLCLSPKNKSDADVASLGWVACGLLSGDFEKPQISGSEMADKFFEIASNPNASVASLLAVAGVDVEPAAATTVEVVDSVAVGTPEIPDVNKQTPAPIPGTPDAVESGSVDAVPAAAEPIPQVMDATPEIVAPTPEVIEPSVPGIKTPAIPNVSAEDLGSMDQKDDMFGDFDKVEVVTDMQSPQSFGSVAPIVVDNPYPQTDSKVTPTGSGDQKKSEQEPVKSKNNTVLFASIGGGVAVIAIGILIYVMMSGNGNEKKSQVASNNTSNESGDSKSGKAASGDSQNTKSDSKSKEDGKGDGKKDGLKSSGMFKGMGAFNSGPGNGGVGLGPKKNISSPNKSTGTGNKTEKEKKVTQPDPEKKKQPSPQNPTPKKPTPKNPEPKKMTGPTPPKKEVNKKAPTPPKKTDDKAQPKTDVTPKQDNKEKAEDDKKSETPVLLLGGNNKDDSKKETPNKPPAKLSNPFVKSPHFVTLQLAKKGDAKSTKKQSLIPLNLPPSLPLTVTLHGGDKATKANIQFELKASTSENATWNVTAGSKSTRKPIGKFTYDGQNFCFQWNEDAKDVSNSAYLINCALRIQASQYKHEVALRAPAVSKLLAFEKNFSPNADAKLDTLPNMENVKVVLVNVPADFAPFDYPKGKDFLVGRSDSTRLYFRLENIDLVQGILSTKLRGSKMVVNLDLKHVTPDKKIENMVSFDKFEKIANQIITEANNLQIKYNGLMKQHAAQPTPEAKAAFTRLNGLTKMREQATLAKRYKTHMEGTLKTIKAIHSKKIGVRIFYQAGEIEVDLATPDGKKYTKPAPAPKADAKKGKKK